MRVIRIVSNYFLQKINLNNYNLENNKNNKLMNTYYNMLFH